MVLIKKGESGGILVNKQSYSTESSKSIALNDLFSIKGVITQPDKKGKRGNQRIESPVSLMAKSLNLQNKNDFAFNLFSNDGEAVILNKNNTKGLLLKGYSAKDFSSLKIINNQEFFGSKDLNNNSISIGRELSFNLNVDIGDIITIMSPSGVQTLVGSLPKQETFKIISIFDSGLSDFNENIAYINLETLEVFFDKSSRPVGGYGAAGCCSSSKSSCCCGGCP